MRKAFVLISVAAGLAACVGGAVLAPAAWSRASCRERSDLVSWIPVAAEQRTAHDAWCAAVGTPVVLPGAPQSDERLDSIAVVSWNVKVGGGDVRRLVTQLRRGVLTGGDRVEHFVLLLQETHRAGDAVPEHVSGARVPRGIAPKAADGTRRPIDVVARELGLSLAYVPSMRNGVVTADAREDRGNAVLSTLPLRDVHAIELPLVRQRRVVVAATVAARTSAGEDWALQVSSVHLENRPARGVTGIRAREQQMQHLLSVLPAARWSLLGGDLNTWVDGASEPAVARALALHPETGPTPDGPTFDGPSFFDMKLDYLFARLPGGRLSRYDRAHDRFGSDHYPVVAWVHLSD